MKILIISNYYPPYYIGGYELACLKTALFLKQHGHEVSILTGTYKHESKKIEPIYRKLKYINYDNSSFINKHTVETYNYKVTKEFIQTTSPDLVYLWSLRCVSIAPAMAVQDLHVKKVFEIGDFWMKGYYHNNFLSKLKRSIKNILPFTIGSKVDFSPVICVSKWMAKEMKNKYLAKNIHVIPNGVNIFEKSTKELDKTIKYMFCGRIDYSKGLDLAIKALGNLKDKGITNFEFHIYGEGNREYIKKCQNIINALNLKKEITFCGKKDDINKYYKQYDILLMPTRMREPFGLVLIEAMAEGVVVIAPNAYGPAEIISHNLDGLLFEEENIDDLTLNIIKVHTNKYLYFKLRDAAFNKVFQDFNLFHVKKEVEKVLLDVVKRDIS